MKILLILLLLVAPAGSITRKITYDHENQYTFYVVHNPEKVDIKKDVEYHWYSDRKIHKSRGTFSGELLHGVYEHQSRDFELKENGRFHLGLKDSIWNTYNEQGALVKRLQFDKGVLDGEFVIYESDQLLVTGTYKNGKKKGQWIDHVKKDTLYYYGGLSPQSVKRDNWLKRQWKKVFKPRAQDSTSSIATSVIKKDSTIIKKVDSVKVKKKSQVKKATKKKEAEYEIRTVNGRKRRYRKGD